MEIKKIVRYDSLAYDGATHWWGLNAVCSSRFSGASNYVMVPWSATDVIIRTTFSVILSPR